MGTHPIFESDFDCLTEDVVSIEPGRPLCPSDESAQPAGVSRPF